MKTRILILLTIVSSWTTSIFGQTIEQQQKPIIFACTSVVEDDNQPLYIVDGIPQTETNFLKTIDPHEVTSIQTIKGDEALSVYGIAGKHGVVVIQTRNGKETRKVCRHGDKPFRVHCIKNTDWVIPQDIYNTLQTKVPSLTIRNNASIVSTPTIRLRGNDKPIIILDGVRVDASILNTLNPQDIESIHVAPSAAATNYFLNGYRAN